MDLLNVKKKIIEGETIVLYYRQNSVKPDVGKVMEVHGNSCLIKPISDKYTKEIILNIGQIKAVEPHVITMLKSFVNRWR